MRNYGVYDNYYGNSYEETLVMGIVMIITIITLVWALFSLGSYVLKGIGMYTIAKRLGVDYAWLAFIPFARTYLHGELAGSIMLKKKSIQNPGVWLLALPFLYSAVYSILYAIIWFMGFGTLMKAASYDYMPYTFSTGNIMGIIIVFLILMVFVLGYTAFYKALEVLVNHQILERFTSKNMSIAHAILCTIIPLYESICLFVMRNRSFNPGMEPPASTPFMQSPPPGSYYDNSGQTGYSETSMQNGYGNFNGQSAPTDSNNYGSFNGQPAPTDLNNYGSYNGQSAPTDPNNYGNFGSQPPHTESLYSSGSHLEDRSVQTGANNANTASVPTGTTEDTSAGNPVNFVLTETENTVHEPEASEKNKPSAKTDSVSAVDSSADKHTDLL